MARKTSTKTKTAAKKKTLTTGAKAKIKTTTKLEAKKIVSPPSILQLVEVAATIGKIKVPDSMVKQRDKLADAATKLSKRIFNGLDSAEKKADREAKKAARVEAKDERDAKKKTKKLDAIVALKAKLAALEADLSPAAK